MEKPVLLLQTNFRFVSYLRPSDKFLVSGPVSKAEAILAKNGGNVKKESCQVTVVSRHRQQTNLDLDPIVYNHVDPNHQRSPHAASPAPPNRPPDI